MTKEVHDPATRAEALRAGQEWATGDPLHTGPLLRAALDGYSAVWVGSRHQAGDHEKAMRSALAAVLADAAGHLSLRLLRTFDALFGADSYALLIALRSLSKEEFDGLPGKLDELKYAMQAVVVEREELAARADHIVVRADELREGDLLRVRPVVGDAWYHLVEAVETLPDGRILTMHRDRRGEPVRPHHVFTPDHEVLLSKRDFHPSEDVT